MCFYDLITFQCDPAHIRWGTFRATCARNYRMGETCSRRSAYPTYRKALPLSKCQECKELEKTGPGREEKSDMQNTGTKLQFLQVNTQSLDKFRTVQREKVDSEHTAKQHDELNKRRHDEWILKWMSKNSTPSQEMNQSITRVTDPNSHSPWSRGVDVYVNIRKVFEMVVLRSMFNGFIDIDAPLKQDFDRASLALQQYVQTEPRSNTNRKRPKLRANIQARASKWIETSKESAIIKRSDIHPQIDSYGQDIRLFEITSSPGCIEIHGKFHVVKLSESPTYAALSYTWGDIGSQRMITINGRKFPVTENLWYFLHRRTTEGLAVHRFLWIDAICINQQDISERNHQVSLMREIYSKASVVLIWLGRESKDSDMAMEYVARTGLVPLKAKGYGYRALWTHAQGKALYDLSSRPYWRRVWIIQEILNAKKIVVMCGTKRFEWQAFEGLYHKIKVLDLQGWISHHEFAAVLLEGYAMTMIWQRAHYRHQDTPAPLLQDLLEVFQEWQCSDIRDKVYGLLGLVDVAENIRADYSLTAEVVYDQVGAHLHSPTYSMASGDFDRTLRRSLKLPEHRSLLVNIRANRYYQDDWPSDMDRWVGGFECRDFL